MKSEELLQRDPRTRPGTQTINPGMDPTAGIQSWHLSTITTDLLRLREQIEGLERLIRLREAPGEEGKL